MLGTVPDTEQVNDKYYYYYYLLSYIIHLCAINTITVWLK